MARSGTARSEAGAPCTQQRSAMAAASLALLIRALGQQLRYDTGLAVDERKQHARGATRPPPLLLPLAQRSVRDADRVGKVLLRQTGGAAGVPGSRADRGHVQV